MSMTLDSAINTDPARDAWQHEADEATIERWEFIHAGYWRHRNGIAEHKRAMAQHEKAMRELAPEYCRAVWRARARYDEEHAWSPSANGHDAERGEEALATTHET